MRAKRQVMVQLEGTEVPGLVMEWRREGQEALVTYEVDGRVVTETLPAERLVPVMDPLLSPEPADD